MAQIEATKSDLMSSDASFNSDTMIVFSNVSNVP